MRTTALRRLLLPALLCLPAVAAAQAARTDTTRLRFGWTPGSRAEVRFARSKVRVTQGQADSSGTSWRFAVEVGRERDARLLHVRSLREGAAKGDAAGDGDTATVATIVVRRDGTEPAVRGAAVLGERLGAALQRRIDETGARTPELRELLEGLRSSDYMAGQVQATYVNLVGFWLGGAFEDGAEYTMASERELPLMPGAALPTTLRFAITERLRCAPGRADTSCVRLVLEEEAHPDSVQALIMRFLRAAGLPASGITLRDVGMQRRIELVTEPWSLVPYAYFETDDYRFSVEAEGEQADFRETRADAAWFTWERERPALHRAAVAGDERAIAAALRDDEGVDDPDADGLTALYLAAANGRSAAVKRLVRARADVARAEALARGRGDVVALRELRASAGLPRRPGSTLAAGREQLEARELAAAVPILTDVAADEARPGDAHAALASALLYDDQDSSAVAIADAVVALAPCHAGALRTLRDAWDPLWSGWSRAEAPRAAELAGTLARCAPEAGDSWFGVAWHAARRGEVQVEADALRRLEAAPLFSEAQLALGRFYLEAVPPRAIVVVDGELDFVTMRQLQQRGVRPDVALVEYHALEFPGYLRVVRDLAGLPLPFDDATLDSLDRAGDYWAPRVADHWRQESRRGALARGLAFTPATDTRGIGDGADLWGNGAMVVVGDTGRTAAPDPREAWARVRAVAGVVAGPPTRADDPQPGRSRYDVTRDVMYAGIAYLNHVNLEVLELDEAQEAAADSLVAWLEARSDAMSWSGRDAFRGNLASSRMELRSVAFARGARARARRQAEMASRLAPEAAGPRLALGTSALLAGEVQAALELHREAVTLERTFDGLLVAANTWRIAGEPDSSLAWLAIAQQMVDNTDEEQRADVGLRRFLHLPGAAADTLGAPRYYRTEAFAELAALVSYEMALAEAMRGAFGAADGAMVRARGLSVAGELRCYVRNQLQATRTLARLEPAVEAWYRRQEAELPCAGAG